MSGSKKCRDCGDVKPATEFWKRKASPDGLSLYCRECFGLRNAKSYRGGQAAEGKQARPYRRYSAVPEGMKYCPQCEETKPIDAFGGNRSTANGRASYCKPCHNAVMAANKARHHGSQRSYMLKRRYGLTADEIDVLRRRQGEICVVCLRGLAEHVDHDHLTGLFRGLLCFGCNGGLGQFEDEVWRLEEAADYLEGRSSFSRRMRLEIGATGIDAWAKRREQRTRAPRGGGRASKRQYRLRSRYGINEADADFLLGVQGGHCAICGDRAAEHVDHCHDSQVVRGLLCGACNSGMGQLRDDPGTLRRAAAYLLGTLISEIPAGDGEIRLSFTYPDVDPAMVALDGWARFREQDASYRRAVRDFDEAVEWVPWTEITLVGGAVPVL